MKLPKSIKTLGLTLLAVLSIVSGSLAQSETSSQTKVVYLVSLHFHNGSINRENIGELYFDEQTSLFSYDRNTFEEEEKVPNKDELMVGVVKPRRTDSIGLVIYSDFDKRKMIERQLLSERGFIISDSLRTINWSLQDEKKRIGDLDCQKALATIHGRKYEAWFAPAIAFPYGPWKLQGLPGLIVEARSADGEVNFELQEIKSIIGEHVAIQAPTAGEPIEGFERYSDLLKKKSDESLKRTKALASEMMLSQGNESLKINIKRGTTIGRIELTPRV